MERLVILLDKQIRFQYLLQMKLEDEICTRMIVGFILSCGHYTIKPPYPLGPEAPVKRREIQYLAPATNGTEWRNGSTMVQLYSSVFSYFTMAMSKIHLEKSMWDSDYWYRVIKCWILLDWPINDALYQVTKGPPKFPKTLMRQLVMFPLAFHGPITWISSFHSMQNGVKSFCQKYIDPIVVYPAMSTGRHETNEASKLISTLLWQKLSPFLLWLLPFTPNPSR